MKVLKRLNKIPKQIKRKFKIFYFEYLMSLYPLGGYRKKGISDKFVYRRILKLEKHKIKI